jgi:hypothetical protein
MVEAPDAKFILQNRVTNLRFAGLSDVKLEKGVVTMLSCKEVSERASALIDGERGLFDLLQMRLHLAMCKGCNAFVRQMRTTRDLTNSALEIEPADIQGDDQRISAILSQLQEEKQSGS